MTAKKSIVIFLVLLLSVSCSTVSEDKANTENNENTYQQLYSKSMAFARDLAVDMSKEESIKNEIIAKIALKVDGDTELLLEHFSSSLKTRYKKHLNNLGKNYRFELRMPKSKLWSLNEIENAGGLRIIVYPFGKDDKTVLIGEGYSKTGEKAMINMENYKTIPYLVIALNERTDVNGKFTFGKYRGLPIDLISFENTRQKNSVDKNQKLSSWETNPFKISIASRHKPPTDDDYWGIHYCEERGEPFCWQEICIFPPPSDNSSGGSSSDGDHYIYNYSPDQALSLNQTTSTNKGFRIKKIRFEDGFDSDGLFDGELEVRIKFYQSDLNFSFSTTVDLGPFSIPAGVEVDINERNIYFFSNDHVDEDGETISVNTDVLYNTDLARTPFPIIQDLYFYNLTLYLKAWEIDSFSDDDYWGGNRIEISNIREWIEAHVTTGSYSKSWGSGIHIYWEKVNY